MQRVGLQQIEVGVAEADVKLDRQLLRLGYRQRPQYQVVVQWLAG